MKVFLAYGPAKLEVDLPGTTVEVIEPRHQSGLSDEKKAVLDALDNPIGTKPLSAWLKRDCRICISFTDITRATPNHRMIPWLLEYLHNHGVTQEQVTLLNQLGTHRPNTIDELKQILTAQVVDRYRVLNHEPENPNALVQLGVMNCGAPALVNRYFVEADVRIATGFIEPHLFAGFSGGVKNVIPGLGGLTSIKHNHGFANLLNPKTTFGITEGNPLWEELRTVAMRVGPTFLLNVALNRNRHVTGVFAGHILESHNVGIGFVRESAMQRVTEPYDIVITTNSGYPLDLNLYQSVKGMSAAGRIVRTGGTIILAAECREGLPTGSPFEKLMRSVAGPSELLKKLEESPEPFPDQWQAQIQAQIQQRARVLLFSAMGDEQVRAAHLEPCHNIAEEVRTLPDRGRKSLRIAVLPQGPLTIPYIAEG
jgi:nickel-dependent lactate racemase